MKNKPTGTGGEGIMEGIGEVTSKNMYKGHMDKAKGGQVRRWEVGMGGAGGHGGVKMETTILEQ